MNRIKFLIILFIIFPVSGLIAQDTKNEDADRIKDKQRVIYIYNFTKYVDWKNIENYTHFNIGVLEPGTSNLFEEVKTYTANKQIKNLPINVVHFKNIAEISNVHILYVHQNSNFTIETITNKIANYQTLLIGEEYPFHVCMINFIDLNGDFNFEINKEKINQAGLFVDPSLLSFAIKSTSDWETLFKKLEKHRERDQKLVEEQLSVIKIQENKISKQREEIKSQILSMELQKLEVELQKSKIESKELEFDSLSNSVRIQQGRVKDQVEILNKHKKQIVEQKKLITNQNLDVQKQDIKLINQKNRIQAIEDKINKKDKTLSKQSIQIENQQWVIYISVLLAVLLFLIAFLFYWSYRSKKRSNAKLEEKNIAILTQSKEIERQKDAIEKGTATLIKSARMVSLGQVAANMAHEVNTPLGAIKSSAEQTFHLMNDFIDKLTLLAENDSTVINAFNILLKKHSKVIEYRTTAEDRIIRNSIQLELSKKGMVNSRFMADLLLMGGITEITSELEVLISQSNNENLIITLTNFLRRRVHVSTILLAVDKAARVVNAFKSYSKTSEENIVTEVNLNENIDTVLVIYQNLLKKGIEVTKEYMHTKIVKGYANKLTQVWTNIIHNAIQAIDEKGHLTINSSDYEEGVLIKIQDDGGGIKEIIKDKVFDAFFTTKEGAEGTGLGLDIAKEIINEHNGKIWLESTEKVGTTFFIYLPVK